MADRRIFIAIDISDEARRQIAAYVEDLRRAAGRARVKWERPDKLHLTLKFLGDTDPSRIKRVEDAVERVAQLHTPLDAEVAGTGVFPNAAAPAIMWLGVSETSGQIAAIATGIEKEFAKPGYKREKRSFHPHITIARIRDPRAARHLSKIHLENEFGPIAFDVRNITIYESKLLPTGSIYSVVSEHALGHEPDSSA